VRFQPKLARQADRLEIGFRLPVDFLTDAGQFAMVNAVVRDGNLVADLEAEPTRLREPKMMGIARLTPSDRGKTVWPRTADGSYRACDAPRG
jgi:hypothetical protein